MVYVLWLIAIPLLLEPHVALQCGYAYDGSLPASYSSVVLACVWQTKTLTTLVWDAMGEQMLANAMMKGRSNG